MAIAISIPLQESFSFIYSAIILNAILDEDEDEDNDGLWSLLGLSTPVELVEAVVVTLQHCHWVEVHPIRHLDTVQDYENENVDNSPIESSWSWLAEMFGCSWQIWGRNVKAAVSLTFKLLSNSKNTEKKGEAQTHRHSLPPQSICHTPDRCYSDIHSIIQLLEYEIPTANTTSWPVCDLKSEQYRCRSPFSRTNVSSPIPIP